MTPRQHWHQYVRHLARAHRVSMEAITGCAVPPEDTAEIVERLRGVANAATVRARECEEQFDFESAELTPDELQVTNAAWLWAQVVLYMPVWMQQTRGRFIADLHDELIQAAGRCSAVGLVEGSLFLDAASMVRGVWAEAGERSSIGEVLAREWRVGQDR